ncbi:MAG: ABC transporter ATP-binding protein [Acidobacteriota bacterium]
MSPEPALRVEGLGKRYRVGRREQRHDTLVGAVLAALRAPVANLRTLRRLSRFDDDGLEDDVLWALHDISFEVEQGEVIGVIGHNGAGKSTLLKLLSRITEPSAGRAVIEGRVASLLEVGTGFHPELTGRENIYLNGSVLGMTRAEIEAKFDQIVAFAEVERFVDTPVKRYSSGMKVRLAFAVAAHLEPEILLVDEVLAVGDLRFQQKSLGKMNEVSRHGRTVLFVSHHMGAISTLCPRCIWLHRGRLRLDGPTDQVIAAYVREGSQLGGARLFDDEPLAQTDELVIRGLSLRGADGTSSGSIDVRRPFGIEIEYEVLRPMTHCRIGVFVQTHSGTIVFDSYDADHEEYFGPRVPGRYVSRAEVPGDFLMPGGYALTINADITGVKRLIRLENALLFEVYDTGAVGTEIGGRRRGVVLPKLDWRVRPLDAGSGG